jgi:hypothetical protein
VRIPRLTRNIGWRLAGLALLLSSLWVFPAVVTKAFLNRRIGPVFLVVGADSGVDSALDHFHTITRLVGIPDMSHPALGILSMVGVVFLIAWLLGRLRPSWGAKPLLLLGGAIIFAILGFRLSDTHRNEIRLREALGKTGLSGNYLTEATNMTMAKLAEHAGDLTDFDAQAEKEANQLIRDPKFASVVKSLPAHALKGGQPSEVKLTHGMKAAQPGPTWPLFVAGAVFLYLWWLAALLFDLVVTWQHYIRNAAILDRLHDIHPLPSGNVAGPPYQSHVVQQAEI